MARCFIEVISAGARGFGDDNTFEIWLVGWLVGRSTGRSFALSVGGWLVERSNVYYIVYLYMLAYSVVREYINIDGQAINKLSAAHQTCMFG